MLRPNHLALIPLGTATGCLVIATVVTLVPASGCGEDPTTMAAQNGLCDIVQDPGDCKRKVCIEGGEVKTVNDDTDMPPPNENWVACYRSACADGLQTKVKADDGTACAGGVCSDGLCIECIKDTDCPDQEFCSTSTNPPVCTHCHDGTQNGDEEAVDCGGSCGKCANGTACNGNGTLCQSGICVDGVCCNNACTAKCYSCNQQGEVGKCLPVPSGKPDDTCGSNEICDGDSHCGRPCNDSSDCIGNDVCNGVICR